jgi:hypothetical protein
MECTGAGAGGVVASTKVESKVSTTRTSENQEPGAAPEQGATKSMFGSRKQVACLIQMGSLYEPKRKCARSGNNIGDPPQPYWQTVERLLADHGIDHVARLLAYALRDLDKAQGKA